MKRTEIELLAPHDYPILTFLARKVREVFGLDIRSLAVFRIGLALVLLRDLSIRAAHLQFFYADSGVLPRRDLFELYPERYHISLYFMSGLWEVQALLMLLAALVGLMLLVGFQTRLATLLSWVLLISVQARNPLEGHSGDVVLRCLLFWGMFLPLGACYSLDRARDTSGRAPARWHFSAATFALLLQVAFIYFFSGLLKTDDIWRKEGSAVWYALSLEQFSTEFGRYLLHFPALLSLLSFATLYLELYGVFLPFIPFWNAWFRMVAIAAFVSFHLGLILTMGLGIFPYACWVGWSAFLPAAFWDFLERRWARSERFRLVLVYDEQCDLCRRLLTAVNLFFFFSLVKLQPADGSELQDDDGMPVSWAVLDSAGKRRTGLAAVAYLCRQATILWPLGWLLAWRPCTRLAEGCYRWLAEPRRHRERWLFFLRPAPLQLETRFAWLGNALVLFLVLNVAVWNLRTINDTWFDIYTPRVNWIVTLPRLDQNWRMFAPRPARDDGWGVVVAKLSDGSEVDLEAGGGPVTDDKPPLISAIFPDHRLQKYMMNLWSGDHQGAIFPYLRYRCQKWNAAHPDRRVIEARMYHWSKFNTYGQPPRLEKVFMGDWLATPPRH